MSSEEISLRVSVRSKRGLFLLTHSCWNVIQRQSVSALISAEQQQPLLGPNAPPRLWSSHSLLSGFWKMYPCPRLREKFSKHPWGFWDGQVFSAPQAFIAGFLFFWGGLVCFLLGFFCHELLHMLSRPPAKPNETQTQPPRLCAT